jgi:hypothetical protein
MKKLRSHLTYRTLFASALMACTLFLGTGCKALKNGNPETIDALKAAFKKNVASATLLASKEDPKVRLYLEAAGPAICDLNQTRQFGPSQIEAALDGVVKEHPELNTAKALLARTSLMNLYTLTSLSFGFAARKDFETNSFAAHLTETLCDGITEGLSVLNSETIAFSDRDTPGVTGPGTVTAVSRDVRSDVVTAQADKPNPPNPPLSPDPVTK